MRNLMDWITGWWTTFRIWRTTDAETWAILTGPTDPNDFVEVERP
jgi:hypothetical protein